MDLGNPWTLEHTHPGNRRQWRVDGAVWLHGIKAGVSQEDAIRIASYGESIGVEFVSSSIIFSKCSFRIFRWSREQAEGDAS